MVLAVVLVWLYQGLWCKVLGGCPGHRAIVAALPPAGDPDWTPVWGNVLEARSGMSTKQDVLDKIDEEVAEVLGDDALGELAGVFLQLDDQRYAAVNKLEQFAKGRRMVARAAHAQRPEFGRRPLPDEAAADVNVGGFVDANGQPVGVRLDALTQGREPLAFVDEVRPQRLQPPLDRLR